MWLQLLPLVILWECWVVYIVFSLWSPHCISASFGLWVSPSPQAVQYFAFLLFFYLFEGDEVELLIRLLLIRLVLLLPLFVVAVAFVITSVVDVSLTFIVVAIAFVVAPVVCSIVLFPLPVTWVHPSSGFGWSPGFRAWLVVGLMIFSWLLLLLLLMLLLVWLLFNDFVGRFWQDDPVCLQD